MRTLKKINDFRVEVENITNTINNLRTEQAQNAIEEIRKKIYGCN